MQTVYETQRVAAEPSFLKLNRSHAINRLMGFMFTDDIDEDKQFSVDKTALKVPLSYAVKIKTSTKEETVVKAEAGTRLKLVPNCIISPYKEYSVWVQPNPLLHEYATLSYSTIHSCTKEKISPYLIARFDRAFDLSKLDYLVELRLMR